MKGFQVNIVHLRVGKEIGKTDRIAINEENPSAFLLKGFF